MRLILTGAMMALLVILPLASAQAEDAGKSKAAGSKYEAAKGPFVQGSFAILKTNNNSFGFGKPNLGFGIAGGYRFNEWVSADGEFVWGGRSQGGGKTRQFGVTLNAKVYPIGLFAPNFLDSFQPYGVVGFGGGNFKVKDTFPNAKTGTFIFRFGAGLDWVMTDHFASFVDLSLHATPGLKGTALGGPKGGATGVIQFGGRFTF